jgi:hypothetical protein
MHNGLLWVRYAYNRKVEVELIYTKLTHLVDAIILMTLSSRGW